MLSENAAFQVLVPTANTAALAAGNPVSALAIGQIGFFSYETNLSIDGTNAQQNRSFYIAVGVDPLATGSLADITKSAGNTIQQVGIRAFTYKPYQAPQNKVIQLKVGAVTCNTEYGVRFELRNQALGHVYGFNWPHITFTGFSAPCAEQCVDCASGDPNSVVQALINEINLDPNNIFVASAVSPTTGNTISNIPAWKLGFNSLATPTAPTGTPVTGTGAAAAATYTAKIVAINADGASLPSPQSANVVLSATGEINWAWTAVTGAVSYQIWIGGTSYFTSSTNSYTQVATAGTAGTIPAAGVAVTGNANAALTAVLNVAILPDALSIYAQVNLKYINFRQTNVFLSLLTDPNVPNGWGTFGPDTTQSDLQEMVYEDGSGYDIQQLEYIAGGWNGKPGPYRTSELVGVPLRGAQFYSTVSGTYNLYAITYDNIGIGGGHAMRSSLATYIAVPSANTTAENSINAFLQRIVNGASGNDSTVDAAYPVANSYNSGIEAL